MDKHEYLKEEDYYESRPIGTRAKSDKTCEYCGKTIPKGQPHVMHHFYPEFESYATHKGYNPDNGDNYIHGEEDCSSKFIKSLN